jgi:hypothetical protein
MLVSSIDGRIDAVPFGIDIGLHRFKEALPLSSPRPAIEAVEDRLPGPKFCWQVTPGRARSSPPQDSLDEEAVVLGRPPHVPVLLQKRCDFAPLSIVKLKADHRGPLMEHDFRRMDSAHFRDRP